MEVQTIHKQGAMPRELPMKSFNQSVIKSKTGLLSLAAELGNISTARRVMGFSCGGWRSAQAGRTLRNVSNAIQAIQKSTAKA